MSLSFVSKSVQTTTEDGGFEEKPIEGSEDKGGNQEIAKPLFEQLRANQEQHDMEREEQQLKLMRGTLALDEEEADFLGTLTEQRRIQEERRQQQNQEDLAAFRAARADRYEQQHTAETEKKTIERSKQQTLEKVPPVKVVPKIVAKRRRKPETDELKDSKKAKSEADSTSKSEAGGSGLGSLMAGYGSSSSDDEDDD